MRTAEQIYADLAAMLKTSFPDRDFSGPVGPGTRVFGDIGLSSIELVVLAERLEGYYGRRLPFAAFLGDLRKSRADDLKLGSLVAFLQQHTA
jgi:acyl carrier protein